MDLIGSIKLIENTLSRRYHNPAKSKPTSKNSQLNFAQGKTQQADQNHISVWDEIQVGKNVDTTA